MPPTASARGCCPGSPFAPFEIHNLDGLGNALQHFEPRLRERDAAFRRLGRRSACEDLRAAASAPIRAASWTPFPRRRSWRRCPKRAAPGGAYRTVPLLISGFGGTVGGSEGARSRRSWCPRRRWSSLVMRAQSAPFETPRRDPGKRGRRDATTSAKQSRGQVPHRRVPADPLPNAATNSSCKPDR